MLAIRYLPELAAPGLWTWLRPFVDYDTGGRSSRLLKGENAPMPPELAAVAEGVCGHASFREVVLQGYRDGKATTPCHSDRGITGFSFVFSLGAARTFRVHRGPCDAPVDAIALQCIEGTTILMAEVFHETWHHQVAADPGAGERLSLVFRTAPGRG